MRGSGHNQLGCPKPCKTEKLGLDGSDISECCLADEILNCYLLRTRDLSYFDFNGLTKLFILAGDSDLTSSLFLEAICFLVFLEMGLTCLLREFFISLPMSRLMYLVFSLLI